MFGFTESPTSYYIIIARLSPLSHAQPTIALCTEMLDAVCNQQSTIVGRRLIALSPISIVPDVVNNRPTAVA